MVATSSLAKERSQCESNIVKFAQQLVALQSNNTQVDLYNLILKNAFSLQLFEKNMTYYIKLNNNQLKTTKIKFNVNKIFEKV